MARSKHTNTHRKKFPAMRHVNCDDIAHENSYFLDCLDCV